MKIMIDILVLFIFFAILAGMFLYPALKRIFRGEFGETYEGKISHTRRNKTTAITITITITVVVALGISFITVAALLYQAISKME